MEVLGLFGLFDPKKGHFGHFGPFWGSKSPYFGVFKTSKKVQLEHFFQPGARDKGQKGPTRFSTILEKYGFGHFGYFGLFGHFTQKSQKKANL